jgi:hypothetical protein
MTATFAMTSQIAVIARPKAAAIHEVQGAWIATSLTLLAMTATFAMTGLFMGSPSMNSGQAKARQSRSSFPALAAKGFAVGETLLADNTLVSGQTGATHAD